MDPHTPCADQRFWGPLFGDLFPTTIPARLFQRVVVIDSLTGEARITTKKGVGPKFAAPVPFDLHTSLHAITTPQRPWTFTPTALGGALFAGKTDERHATLTLKEEEGYPNATITLISFRPPNERNRVALTINGWVRTAPSAHLVLAHKRWCAGLVV